MKRFHHVRSAALLPLIAGTLLGGCATDGMARAERLALVQANAGAPVAKVRYYDPIAWEELDGSHLLLTTRPSEQYLMTLSGPCLDWGGGPPIISISSSAGYVTAGFDRVIVSGSTLVCRILEIRPVDVRALRAAQASGT